jgi:hypothetical protein
MPTKRADRDAPAKAKRGRRRLAAERTARVSSARGGRQAPNGDRGAPSARNVSTGLLQRPRARRRLGSTGVPVTRVSHDAPNHGSNRNAAAVRTERADPRSAPAAQGSTPSSRAAHVARTTIAEHLGVAARRSAKTIMRRVLRGMRADQRALAHSLTRARGHNRENARECDRSAIERARRRADSTRKRFSLE